MNDWSSKPVNKSNYEVVKNSQIGFADFLVAIIVVVSLIIGLYILNIILFNFVFSPNYDLDQNYFLGMWFALTMTALEVGIYRVITGKLKINLTISN